MKKIITVLLIAALIVAGAILLKKRNAGVAATAAPLPPSIRVRTITPQPRDVQETSRFLAQIEPKNRVEISTKLSAEIATVLVSESMKVEQDTPLVHMDDTDISTAIAGLKAQISAADSQRSYNESLYERNLALYEAGGLAKEKLDASEVSRNTARASVTDLNQKLAGLQNQLQYLHIKAPMPGIIGTVFQHPGDLAVPGKTMLTINSMAQKLTFRFMPNQAAIKPGQKVLYKNQPLGEIDRLYDDAANGLTIAEISLPSRLEGTANNSFLTIDVVTKTASGCSVPIQSLLHRSTGQSIMVYQDDRFQEQQVTVSGQDDNFAIITPCPSLPVAVASGAKLSILPTHGKIRIFQGKNNE